MRGKTRRLHHVMRQSESRSNVGAGNVQPYSPSPTYSVDSAKPFLRSVVSGTEDARPELSGGGDESESGCKFFVVV